MMIFTGILLCIFLPVLNAIDTEVYVQELNSQNFAVCHNKRKFSCPDSNSSLKLRIKSCGFKCEPGTTYVCKNDKGGRGVLEFCFEPQICEKGQMNKVFFDDEHQQIVIQKSVCPDGFFQPVRDDCFKACTDFKHEDPGLISYWGIKVLYSGNNTHPGRGYCDVDNGFVSSDTSKMYTSLAHNEVSVCEKLDTFKSICGPGKRLLPNRQCGNICRKGYVVDRWNYFKCSMGSHNRSTVIKETTAHPDQNVTP
ncbi:uncharacterized protein LOC132714116, partial [Ruditapes philippinarum]|uniref:uncharacterized protein LOC132714116 n=1 Tax=Ruditapes philippinarum TaxID=129788 RepID=UPI00295C049C